MDKISLYSGIAATGLVGYWMVKKVFKLALYAAIAGAALWFWYFQVN
jgi:hypothetical protein